MQAAFGQDKNKSRVQNTEAVTVYESKKSTLEAEVGEVSRWQRNLGVQRHTAAQCWPALDGVLHCLLCSDRCDFTVWLAVDSLRRMQLLLWHTLQTLEQEYETVMNCTMSWPHSNCLSTVKLRPQILVSLCKINWDRLWDRLVCENIHRLWWTQRFLSWHLRLGLWLTLF